MSYDSDELIVCIKDDWDFHHEVVNYPVKDRIYSIRAVRTGMFKGESKYFLLLCEVVNRHIAAKDGSMVEPAFMSEYFRPVKKPRIDSLAGALLPTEEDIRREHQLQAELDREEDAECE